MAENRSDAEHKRDVRPQAGQGPAPIPAPILEVRCPDCGSQLRIDSETGMVLAHKPVPARSVDLDRSQELLRRQQEERDLRFQQSVKAEKNRDQLLTKKFDQSLRRVRDNPDEPRPLRDVDLD